MQLIRRIALSALVVVPTMPAILWAQERQSEPTAFTLNERIPAGQWIRVRNVNGEINVRAASGDNVEVVATKTWRRGDPRDVRIEARKASDGSILVCAFWTENASCSESGYESHGDGWRSRNNDVAVDFEVRVPKGVKVGVWTVNGGVRVDGASSEVRAGTVNGSVAAGSSSGPVTGSTVNGNVHATMGRFDSGQDLDYRTVNGTIVAEFTGDVDADVDLNTVNGRFITDWPVTLTGRIDPRHLRATVGKGGGRIRMSTVNGNVELRKR